VEDRSIFEHINDLVDEEHRLRSTTGAIDDASRARLADLEGELDRCWDLLRQRRARREFGQDPDDAQPRSEGTVEGYLQ
jgi:Protein of unknown function (DUF2630)